MMVSTMKTEYPAVPFPPPSAAIGVICGLIFGPKCPDPWTPHPPKHPQNRFLPFGVDTRPSEAGWVEVWTIERWGREFTALLAGPCVFARCVAGGCGLHGARLSGRLFGRRLTQINADGDGEGSHWDHKTGHPQ